MSDTITPREQGAAMQQLAEESPEAVGMVATYLAASERERSRIDEMVEEHRQRELDEWKERALKAEAQLYKIEQRVMSLLFD